MTPISQSNPLSNCHKAPLTVVHGQEGTSFYLCSLCKQPADPLSDQKEALKGDGVTDDTEAIQKIYDTKKDNLPEAEHQNSTSKKNLEVVEESESARDEIRDYKYPDSDFLIEFRKLKQLRNTHQIDEPDFDERVEQLAADIYGHKTVDGWCCACEVDQAFMEGRIKDAVKRAKIEFQEQQQKELKKLADAMGIGFDKIDNTIKEARLSQRGEE